MDNHDALDQQHHSDPAESRRRLRTWSVVVGATVATAAVVGAAWAVTGHDSPTERTGTHDLAAGNQSPTPAPTPVTDGTATSEAAPSPSMPISAPTSAGPAPTPLAPTNPPLEDDKPSAAPSAPSSTSGTQFPAPTPTAAPATPLPTAAAGRPGGSFARYTKAGTFVPRPGVTVLEQRSGVDLGANFAPASKTGVAHLERGSTQWWAVARRVDGISQVIVVKDATVQVDTLDEFIVWAQGVYGAENGEGLL